MYNIQRVQLVTMRQFKRNLSVSCRTLLALDEIKMFLIYSFH